MNRCTIRDCFAIGKCQNEGELTILVRVIEKDTSMNRLWRVLYQPQQVFDEIRGETPITLPLCAILVVGLVCDAMIVLTDTASPYFFFEVVVAIFLSLWSLIGTLLLLLVWASYYWIAGKFLRGGIDWRDWFSFTCWAAVPAVLGSIGGMLIFELTGVNTHELLEPYPFCWWFGTMVPNVFLIPIPLIWTFFIAVNGLKCWTGRNTVTCVLVALIPVVALAVSPTNSIAIFPFALMR